MVIRFDIGLNICYLLFITVKRLISQILAGILGLYLAIRFIPDVEFIDPWRWEILIFAGIVLGLINFFIKPVLKIITLPLRIFTFGLFSLIINMGMVWIVARIFSQLKIFTILSIAYPLPHAPKSSVTGFFTSRTGYLKSIILHVSGRVSLPGLSE